MTEAAISTVDEVYAFWFGELSKKDWFEKNSALDEAIAKRFSATHLSLARGEFDPWRRSPKARLAAIIVLDQFSRNMYRGSPLAFAADWIALREAQAAVEAGEDQNMPVDEKAFLYLPFEHSENLADQDRSVELFSKAGDEGYLDYARRHRKVIEQFGRFPHRNATLGRQSTAAELAYLAQPGAGF